MATCPRCLEALTDDHKCRPRGMKRLVDGLSILGFGSLVGALACFAIDERPTAGLLLASSGLGIVLTAAIRQAIGARS